MTAKRPEPRGRAEVEAALVQAAADALAEAGPRAASVRDIATRAGVNHGQVHHYFGGKAGLLRAAMRHLAAEHHAHATERAGGGPIPPPLSLAADERYWRAVLRTVLDGELDLALVELEDDVSVPRRALDALVAARGAPADVDLHAKVGASVALQLAWVALEDFVFAVTDVPPTDRDAVRARVADLALRIVGPDPFPGAGPPVAERLTV